VNTEKEYRAVRGYGLDTPVCIVPNGVSLPDEEPSSGPPWSSAIPNDSKVLLFLGRIHPKKGLRELLEAWGWVQNRQAGGGKWRLAIIGWDDGGHQPELETYVAEQGLGSSVFFLGPKFGTEKAAAFHHADAFILPSYSEGLPMAVLEAWSYGLPVVMTPDCNIPEGFEEEAALKIDPAPSSIEGGLDQLFAHSEGQLAEMGERGRALVEQKFTWDAVAEQMYDVYRWMLGEEETPSCVRLE